MVDTSHIPVERLREPMPTWAGDIIRQQRAEIERLRAAIRWVLGEEPDSEGKWFSHDMPTSPADRRPYWWRTHLRKLSGYEQSQRSTEG